MRALRTAASGMAAQQLNVEVISNNIANMNTVGFKKQRAEFQDLLYQNVERMGAQSSAAGTVVPTGIQIGAGVKAGAVYRITKQGQAVLGGGAEIVLDPNLGAPSVGADGTITQNGQVTGRLSVVRFDTLGVLEKGGDSLYRNKSNAQPIEAADAQVHQGSLESSNVNPLIEITNLVEISRAYESVSRMIDNTNDLSRRAVERLGKAA